MKIQISLNHGGPSAKIYEIIKRSYKVDELIEFLDTTFNKAVTETELNDFIYQHRDYLFTMLDIEYLSDTDTIIEPKGAYNQ